ncbi:hypothetical protein NDU88_004059 [Pleurodeles waltl]|uniref:Uncharacterized protein n=1 Tax=Pleurodeles waltl TaxID=8319 RepID=A0AAV7W7B0_PLEWA|nr:hypothetical protein NDU88_004059 [Pleurodeles waltl]
MLAVSGAAAERVVRVTGLSLEQALGAKKTLHLYDIQAKHGDGEKDATVPVPNTAKMASINIPHGNARHEQDVRNNAVTWSGDIKEGLTLNLESGTRRSEDAEQQKEQRGNQRRKKQRDPGSLTGEDRQDMSRATKGLIGGRRWRNTRRRLHKSLVNPKDRWT